MWKLFFDTLYFLSYFIPFPRTRRWFRDVKLFGYGAKKRALLTTCPDLAKQKMRLAKGGGSLAFIIGDTVFKVRKRHRLDNSTTKFMREKRITDAMRPFCPVALPHIDIVHAGEFTYYKTQFIPGSVLVDLPLEKIREHREKIGRQLGDIIYGIYNADMPQIDDFRTPNGNGEGWIHGDMCSNIIVNPDTMDVTGIIDWEYARYSTLRDEFIGLVRVRRKMRLTDIQVEAICRYYELVKKHGGKK